MKKILYLALVVSLIGVPRLVAASTPAVIISELAWAGSELSSSDEYLELYNPGEEAIDLTGWSIDGAATSGETLLVPDGVMIAPNSTYLISNYAQENSSLNIEPHYSTASLSLSNSKLLLVLRDGSGTQIDSAGDGGSPHAGFSGTGELGAASMVRVDAAIDGAVAEAWVDAALSMNFDPEVVQYGTPGYHQIQVADVPTPEPEPEEDPAAPEAPEEEVPIEEPPVDEPAPETPAEEPPVEEQPIGEQEPEPPADPEEEPPVDPTEEPAPEESTEAPEEEEPPAILAYPPGILIINEFVSDPANGSEWVEIFNPLNNVIPLEGWVVTEGGSTKVQLSGLLGFEQFVVIEFSNRLNNSGDHIELVDATGAVIDAVSYGDWADAEAPKANDPDAVARDIDGTFVVTTSPTPGQVNLITNPVESETEVETTEEPLLDSTPQSTDEAEILDEPEAPRPTTLEIVKLLPDPEGEEITDEYIVLYNFGSEPVNLEGWTIGDIAKTLNLHGVLPAGLLLTLPRSVTKIALNNTSSETVTLVSPEGDIIDVVTYEKAQEGFAYVKGDAGWFWTRILAEVEPTDVSVDEFGGSVESSTQTNHSDSSVISKKTTNTSKKKISASKQTTLEGVVIATPGTFGRQIMYINGMQLYQYYGDFPDLVVGDAVRVVGEKSTSRGEARLKLAKASAILVTGSDYVVPLDVSLSDFSAEIGTLIRVQGDVIQRSGDRFVIEQDGEELLVVIKDGTQISLSVVELGSPITVTGVLTTYNGKLKLLPRSPNDLSLESTEGQVAATASVEEASGPGDVLIGSLIALLTSFLLIALAYKHRRSQKQNVIPTGTPATA